MSDIDILAQEGRVTVSAQRMSEFESEKTYRQYHQSFTLPENVDPEQIQARYEDGVLHLGLPKAKKIEKETKKIDVKTGSDPQKWLKFLGFGRSEIKPKISAQTNEPKKQ